MADRTGPPGHLPMAVRTLRAAFGMMFVGGGLTALREISSEASSLPTLLRLLLSSIAIAVSAAGVFMLITVITGRDVSYPGWQKEKKQSPPQIPETPVGYTCSHCGGTLDSSADVSPLGDTKCEYCDRWFNIHRQG